MLRLTPVVSRVHRVVGPNLRCYSYEAEPYVRRDVRRKDLLPKNPNHTPALLNGPDYTFVDGRPTPYGSRSLQRMAKQQKYTEQIIKLTREVDTARATYKRKLNEKEREIQEILDSKFQPKGVKVLEP